MTFTEDVLCGGETWAEESELGYSRVRTQGESGVGIKSCVGGWLEGLSALSLM